jgi:GLPGLI family protein
MRQALFILLFFTFSVGTGLAQKNSSQERPPVNPGAPTSRKALQMAVVDSGNIRILYALNATDIRNPETYDDLQCLEIGARTSKYYSLYVFSSDSLTSNWVKKHPNAKDEDIPSYSFKPKGKFQGWSEYIYSEYFKDFSKNELTEYARMPYSLQNYNSWYSEPLPLQNWEIGQDTLRIASYLCQNATCRFRGRDYTAWFTTDIPISNGPWKFGGLPGLILKVYDKDRQYVFECIGIENHKRKYTIKMLEEFKRYKKSDRQKLWKSKKEAQENYTQLSGVAVVYTGNVIAKSKPYIPLELE